MALHVRQLGQGGQPVLALHCGLGLSSMWKGVADALPEAQFTAPDLPGHGRSDPFPDGIDVHDAATDAVRPLLQPGMHLIGHSFGATVALRLALEAADRLRSLTLIEPVFFAAAPDGPIKSNHRRAESAAFAAAAQGDMIATAKGFNQLWGGGVPWDSFPPQAQATMAGQMPFVVGTEPSLWGDRANMLRANALEQLSCPVQLIRGENTVPVIAEIHRGLLARLPNAQERVIAGAGHMLVMTHSDQVAKAAAEVMHPAAASLL